MPSPRSALSQQLHRKCQTCRVWRSCMVTLLTYLFNKTSGCYPAHKHRSVSVLAVLDGELSSEECLILDSVLPWRVTSCVVMLQPDVPHFSQGEWGGQQEQVNSPSLKDWLVRICEGMDVAVSLWAAQLQGHLQDTKNGSISLQKKSLPGWMNMEAFIMQLESKRRLTLAVVPAFLRWPVWTLIR